MTPWMLWCGRPEICEEMTSLCVEITGCHTDILLRHSRVCEMKMLKQNCQTQKHIFVIIKVLNISRQSNSQKMSNYIFEFSIIFVFQINFLAVNQNYVLGEIQSTGRGQIVFHGFNWNVVVMCLFLDGKTLSSICQTQPCEQERVWGFCDAWVALNKLTKQERGIAFLGGISIYWLDTHSLRHLPLTWQLRRLTNCLSSCTMNTTVFSFHVACFQYSFLRKSLNITW